MSADMIGMVLAVVVDASHEASWLDYLRAVLSAASIVGGLLFVLAGSIGVLRLPDFYTRLHAAGMTDTLGAELIFIGLIIQAGFSQVTLKLLLIGFLLLLTSPTATHAVAHAAWAAGVEPRLGRWRASRVEADDT